MSDQRPTPETNEAQFGTGRVSVDFTRRLERERDEARELARELRDALDALLDCEPRQKDDLERIAYRLGRESLTKAKEVLG